MPVLTKTGFHAPTGLAFDHQGNLWVADSGNNQVLAFAHDTYTLIAGDTIPLSQVTDYLQNALAFDQAGNLYVGQSSDPISVHSFVPGYSTPRTGFDITNKTGNADHAAFDLAFDSSGKLWIANTSGLSLDGYTPGSDVPQTIRFDPGTCPSGIAFSGNGTAWVADSYYGGDPYMVYGYTPGTTSAIETIVGANQLPGVMDDVQTIRIAP